MAFLEIPLQSELPSFKFSIQLGVRVYTLQFNWNTRNERWYFDLLTEDETPLLMGQPVLVSYNLIDRFQSDTLPEGRLCFFDSSGANLDPGRTDLGQRVQMFYQEAD